MDHPVFLKRVTLITYFFNIEFAYSIKAVLDITH
jgi:hypothetical protein